MTINFPEVTKSLTDFLLAFFTENKPAVITAVNQFVTDSSERITGLAESAAKGQVSYTFVVERLKEEAINLKDYLLALGEIIAADIQQIINKTVDTLQTAINQAIGAYTLAQ